jgi:hypothetical protein
MCSDLVGKVSQYLRQLAADRASEQLFPGVGENRSRKAKRDYGGGSAIFQPKLPTTDSAFLATQAFPFTLRASSSADAHFRVNKFVEHCRNYKDPAAASACGPQNL